MNITMDYFIIVNNKLGLIMKRVNFFQLKDGSKVNFSLKYKET